MAPLPRGVPTALWKFSRLQNKHCCPPILFGCTLAFSRACVVEKTQARSPWPQPTRAEVSFRRLFSCHGHLHRWWVVGWNGLLPTHSPIWSRCNLCSRCWPLAWCSAVVLFLDFFFRKSCGRPLQTRAGGGPSCPDKLRDAAALVAHLLQLLTNLPQDMQDMLLGNVCKPGTFRTLTKKPASGEITGLETCLESKGFGTIT